MNPRRESSGVMGEETTTPLGTGNEIEAVGGDRLEARVEVENGDREWEDGVERVRRGDAVKASV